jgi:hypothetical protein
MRTTRNGSCKVGETVNSGETPELFLGLAVGACGNLTPDEKAGFNKVLHAQGGEMLFCSAEKLSAWTFPNGVQIEIEHTGKGMGFFTRIS